jgi:hypothetical protein
MDVVDVSLPVVIVVNRVLPVTPLPERLFAAGVALQRHALVKETAEKTAFDRPPPAGIVRTGRIGRAG